MSDETVTEHEEESSGVDEASLAGLSEYSATGGGAAEPHFPRMSDPHDGVDEPEIPDAGSFREMYRYSLGRATQDAQSDGEDDWAEGGPLHVVERKVATKRSR